MKEPQGSFFCRMAIVENRVFCSSSVIERDLNNHAGTYEYPDGILVDRSICISCTVNCPNSPNYIKPSREQLERQLKNSTRHRTLSF